MPTVKDTPTSPNTRYNSSLPKEPFLFVLGPSLAAAGRVRRSRVSAVTTRVIRGRRGCRRGGCAVYASPSSLGSTLLVLLLLLPCPLAALDGLAGGKHTPAVTVRCMRVIRRIKLCSGGIVYVWMSGMVREVKLLCVAS